jgi:tRNA-splicing ligase RtcB
MALEIFDDPSSMKVPIKSWCTNIEAGARAQAVNVANHPAIFHHFALMPDCHQGYGMPIGGVAALQDAISPNMVGVDIGCGMIAVQTDIPVKYLLKQVIRDILEQIKRTVPVGFNRHKKIQTWDGFKAGPPKWMDTKKWDTAKKSLGTLGGGNHFIEIQVDESDCVWLMLHSGSRNLGKTIADFHNRIAIKLNKKMNISAASKDLAFLPSDSNEGKAYQKDMNFALAYALENRKRMMLRFKQIFAETLKKFYQIEVNFMQEINIHHNFAALEKHFGKQVWVHRKGATSAFKNEMGIIPGSMGTPSYIVKGLGNPESFMSCSHGAGRIMGRGQASKTLSKEQCDKAMEGILFDSWHKISSGKKRGLFDLGEAPGAYKNIDSVIEAQLDLVKPVVKLKPLGVVKG